MTVGLWTQLRYGKERWPGAAAVKMWLIAAWPVPVIGLLVGIKALPQVVIRPGDAQVTALALKAYGHTVNPEALIILPILYMPLIWVCGWIGALAGRLLAKLTTSRRRAS